MITRIFNWRSIFFFLAIVIIALTIGYAGYLAKKIEREERQRVAEWIAATQALSTTIEPASITLANLVISNNEDIPLIATDSSGNIIDYHNIDTTKIQGDPEYLKKVLAKIKTENNPLEWELGTEPREVYYVYFGKTLLQKEIQYYPVVQLILVALFVALLIALITTQNRSAQNQVWAGMAKETAHQLGTPLTSLQGWLEVLREARTNDPIVGEMDKDIQRLKLVSERFGKIGSTPQLEVCDIVTLCENMVVYMKRRAPDKVIFKCSYQISPIEVAISPTLFEWVLENLMKNALDALESGKGEISLKILEETTQVILDVSDTGKGISSAHVSKVFNPGFTTKKRGWGLGLSLCKRIVELYHKGQLFVKHSEPGKGTTFRIVLPRG
jgi:signal transduction histidine kinase